MRIQKIRFNILIIMKINIKKKFKNFKKTINNYNNRLSKFNFKMKKLKKKIVFKLILNKMKLQDQKMK